MSNLYGSHTIDQTCPDRGDGQAYHHSGPADLLRSWMLDDVGTNMGASGNTRNLCCLLLPYDHCQGV